jgi:acyl dehydratase
MIDEQALLSWKFEQVEQVYDETFSMLYALSIGLGQDPTDPRQLAYVTENGTTPLRVFPTLAVVLGFPGSWMADPRTGIDFSRIVHGSEEVFFHRELPPAGKVVSRHKVVSVTDKGPGKGAVITYDKELFDASDMTLLATVRHTTFARGDGGFSKAPNVPSSGVARQVDEWAVMKVWETTTLPQQALLYRLCADRNPLHSEPDVARRAGFDQPILHGLATYGIAAHALVAQWCEYDASRLKSLKGRFSSPVIPGDILKFRSGMTHSRITFDVWNETRARVAITSGSAEIA